MLNYLDFETSDDGEGITTFDAMAYATAERWPALQAEVEQVLGWCSAQFGQPGSLEHGHPWDLDLQLQSKAGHALAVHWGVQQRSLVAPDAALCEAAQLSLTISGNASFAHSLESEFLNNDA